jgi:sarcosine oxidase delta subunit
MSFLLTCPNCGPRDVLEFRYGGEVAARANNLPGVQRERWFHRLGCRRWLMAERDVRTNEVHRTEWLSCLAPGPRAEGAS